jgi:HAMP domain-containing protein
MARPLQTFGQAQFANLVGDIKHFKTLQPKTWAPLLTYGLCLGGSGYAQVSWSQGSDIRFKKEIQPLHNSLQKILALEGVSFKYDRTLPNGDKYPDTTQIGFIAQQVEPIVPEVVTTTPEGYKAMSYGNLTSLLTEAIKEQQIQIERLKFSDEQMSDEIKQLKNEIENMKQELKVLKSQ